MVQKTSSDSNRPAPSLDAPIDWHVNGTAAFIVASLVMEDVFKLNPKDSSSVDNFGVAVRIVAAILARRQADYNNMVGVPFEW